MGARGLYKQQIDNQLNLKPKTKETNAKREPAKRNRQSHSAMLCQSAFAENTAGDPGRRVALVWRAECNKRKPDRPEIAEPQLRKPIGVVCPSRPMACRHAHLQLRGFLHCVQGFRNAERNGLDEFIDRAKWNANSAEVMKDSGFITAPMHPHKWGY